MVKRKTKQTAGAAAAEPTESTLLFLCCLPACLPARRIVVPLNQPAPRQPLTACRTGPEPILRLSFSPPLEVECDSLQEALVQLLRLCPSSELFKQIVKEVSLFCVSMLLSM